VFTRSKQELLAAMQFTGLSEILINKIVDFYGFENIENNKYDGLPFGIGELILEKFKDNIIDNLQLVNKFISDSRYNYSNSFTIVKKEIIGSVCFTGKLYTMSRGDASKKAIEAGYEVKSGVSSGLTYLVTNDTESNSAKNKKAKQLGTKVINEEEFLKLISNSNNDVLNDL
jgi:NAD-dependent DNA ligase